MSSATDACAFIALGANLDAPAPRVREAMAQRDQPDFINAVVALQTSLAPLVLMRALLDLETSLGRVRAERNGPRRIDLDLIAFDQRRIDTPGLQLPHPRAIERAFVMVPWAEIAPDVRIGGSTVREVAFTLPRQDIARIEA